MNSAGSENPGPVGAARANRRARALLSVGCLLTLGALAVAIVPEQVAVPGGLKAAREARDAGLVTFEAHSAADLCRVLDEAWGLVSDDGAVPNLAPASLPSDMRLLDTEARKKAFIRSVTPHVLENNRRVREERRALLEVAERLKTEQGLSGADRALVAEYGRKYRVGGALEADLGHKPAPVLSELLRRVDEIPLGLAVGQAAVESAWGSSRLALQENSLFGQFVFASDDSAPPVGKGAERPGLPARFRHIGEAVEAYFRNLNTCEAYGAFRTMRAAMRRTERPADPVALAQGLLPYSELGAFYVETVREVIRDNNLSSPSSAALARFGSELLSSIFKRPGASVVVHKSLPMPEA